MHLIIILNLGYNYLWKNLSNSRALWTQPTLWTQPITDTNRGQIKSWVTKQCKKWSLYSWVVPSHLRGDQSEGPVLQGRCAWCMVHNSYLGVWYEICMVEPWHRSEHLDLCCCVCAWPTGRFYFVNVYFMCESPLTGSIWSCRVQHTHN